MTRTRTKKRRKRKKKIGISLLLLLIAMIPAAQAAKKSAEPDSYALVSGTVFRDSGFALPGATVTLTPDSSENISSKKLKRLQAVCNFRGEFAFRIPPLNMHYTLRAAAKGYREQEKRIEVQGEGRVDVTLSLEKESK
jgi:hypothetical protein